MSVVARVVVGALGALAVTHAYRAWRSGRMPLMVGEADAQYWGKQLSFMRVANLVALVVFGVVFVLGAIFG